MRLPCAALLLAACLAGAEPNYFAPESIAAFADHLFAQGDFLRAGYEYERYLFAQPLAGDELAAAHERAGRAFRCGGDFERALEHFRRMREAAADGRERAAAEIGLSYLHQGDAAGSLSFLQNEPGWQANGRLSRLAAADLILLGRWEEAQQTVSGQQGAEAEQLRVLAHRGASMRRKSPAFAAALSAVVPGTGKMYAGEAGDGLQSLILVGALAALSAVSFHADGVDSWRGWLYVSLGGLMHAGNIYGSAVSARRYNRKQEEALREDLKTLLPACAPASPGYAPASPGYAPGASADAR
jgi:TM2 domain-containing membrane protein YozV